MALSFLEKVFGRKLTVGQIQKAVEALPSCPNAVEAFLTGAEFAGMESPRDKILGVITETLASIVQGTGIAGEQVASLGKRGVEVKAEYARRIAELKKECDADIIALAASITKLREMVAKLEQQQNELRTLHAVFYEHTQ